MVDREAAGNEIEGVVEIGKSGGVTALEDQVADAGGVRLLLAQNEHLGREVEGDHLVDEWSQSPGQVTGPRGDVQDGEIWLDWEVRQDLRHQPRIAEEVLGILEAGRLLCELLSYELVVSGHHRLEASEGRPGLVRLTATAPAPTWRPSDTAR
jgi:hypothetical protein